MADAHLSIGEVLGLLQDEFPDVTISKIRFLESQGLIDPERTPSGYRKFYEPDIERLRWILTQQRENFLPLKVIRERLVNGDDEGTATLFDDPVDPPPTNENHDPAESEAVESDAEPEVQPDAEEPAEAPAEAVVDLTVDADAEDEQAPIWMADLAASKGAKTLRAAEAHPLDAGPTEVSLTAAELASAAGITAEALRQLEQFGLVVGRSYGDVVYYDGDALLIATRSSGFLARGIEARHLRMFKVAAEREAGFLEQVAMPMLKQRNPEARRQAVDLVEELSDLGHDLRAALLRANLRRHLDRS
jgi:DNA-binding transcriptional MerR regulator